MGIGRGEFSRFPVLSRGVSVIVLLSGESDLRADPTFEIFIAVKTVQEQKKGKPFAKSFITKTIVDRKKGGAPAP